MKFITKGAAAGLIVMFVLLGAGVAFNYFTTQAAIHQTAANAASVTQLCQSGNKARADQVQLWEFVIAISPPPPHQTRAERIARAKILHRFDVRLRQIFAARNCQKGLTP